VSFNMPEMRTVSNIHHALNGLWAEISSGKISPDEGAMLGRLEQHAAVLETKELEERIAKLEQAETKRAA
jgi:hypothetical protein